MEDLQGRLASYPGAEPGYPFGPGAQVWKVGGKIFAIVDEDAHPTRIAMKCDPDLALDLREEFPGKVLPGYHLNKRHWNTVILDELPNEELEDWIGHSYELVVASLPARLRRALDEPGS
ncbi:MAG: MmcQ/YjbR family DNA-binding protein [Acidimicrobiia bacterium]|nr:MmcQ/YjbR family DNA-binding protein [Acidimicrobiia bacterium]MDH5422921.1 MmcQ/YjbR family DNA-binding protein [Acidimicrobiia bacterium]MDH5504538.1 MmcQ/YjbR family DNA-binding protein [Acidimicrobiia bacterium]